MVPVKQCDVAICWKIVNLPLLEGRMAGGSVSARKLSQQDQPRKAAIKIARTMAPGPPGTFSAFLIYWTFAVHAGRESMASSREHQSLHHSYGWCSKLYTYLAMCEDQSIYSVLLTKPDSRYVTCFLLPGVAPTSRLCPMNTFRLKLSKRSLFDADLSPILWTWGNKVSPPWMGPLPKRCRDSF